MSSILMDVLDILDVLATPSIGGSSTEIAVIKWTWRRLCLTLDHIISHILMSLPKLISVIDCPMQAW
jgi:hypothetical protein